MLWNLFYLLELVLNLTPEIWFCRANCKQSQQNVQKNNLFWFRRTTTQPQTHKHTMYFNLALWSKFTTQTNERVPANASYKMLVCFCVGKILCEICVSKLDFRLILGCLLANLNRNWHKKFDFDLTVWDELPQLKKQLILVWQFVANQQNNLILQSKLHIKHK